MASVAEEEVDGFYGEANVIVALRDAEHALRKAILTLQTLITDLLPHALPQLNYYETSLCVLRERLQIVRAQMKAVRLRNEYDGSTSETQVTPRQC